MADKRDYYEVLGVDKRKQRQNSKRLLRLMPSCQIRIRDASMISLVTLHLKMAVAADTPIWI